jgi:signal transduction histidine kinase
VIDPRTLRGQLSLGYAGALLVLLVACALFTLWFVDRAQRAALDQQLQIAGKAVGAIVDVRHGRIKLDADDRVQIGDILGNQVNEIVADRRGRTYASSVAHVPPGIAALVADPRSRVVTVPGSGAALRAVVAPVPLGRPAVGSVVVWGDTASIVALDRSLALGYAVAIPLVVALAIVLGGAIAARGLRPLVRLADIAAEIEEHDLSARIGTSDRDDELGRLCATFDRMLDRLEAAFARQRRFTSDASHELRAPLSVIRAEADLMLRRARTPEEYERALRSIADQADELESLTRELLAAARADAGMAAPQLVDVGRAAGEAAERLAPLARRRQIAIHTRLAAEARTRGDAGALRRIATVLLHNALRYANGEVELVVARHNGSVRLSVGDDGAGFSPTALLHATERFWRDDPSRARSPDGRDVGSGLGLSIAEAIVAAMGGTLRTANRDEGGALVTVDVPAV